MNKQPQTQHTDERARERHYMEYHRHFRYDQYDYQAAKQYLWSHGWEFRDDRIDHNGEWRGWWVNPTVNGKDMVIGDSQEFNRSTITMLSLYTDYSLSDLLAEGQKLRNEQRYAIYRTAR